jgi:ABC-2 type transport system ATP-binding protein
MIETAELAKRFGDIVAVDDLTLEVGQGEVLGLLGPNGAGKSTTMKMIAGALVPSAGRARVAGHDVVDAATAARTALGYLPEGAPAYGEMTAAAFLGFVADVRGLRGAQRRRRLAAVIDELDLGAVRHQPIATLSKGFQRRVALAQALVHDPPALIMDEPTDGLDPNQKHDVRRLITAMRSAKTIIVSTHVLDEVEAICTRAAIIDRGQLLTDERPGALLARSRYREAVTLSLAAEPAEAEGVLTGLEGVEGHERGLDGESLTLFAGDGVALAETVRRTLRERGWSIETLRVEGGRLDDVFSRLTRHETEVAA